MKQSPTKEQVEELKAVGYKHPEDVYKRGYGRCCKCGEATRSVLDGEAWCDSCERYQ